jgi:phosphoesterase RecJ-like protein
MTPQETPEIAQVTDLGAVVGALAEHDRFLVVTHENPDGDALGSMLAMTLGLQALGKNARMYVSGTAPLPAEFEFLPLGDLQRSLPEDVGERALLAVDCANERRIGPDPALLELAKVVIDVDHHHDNSRFGSLNLIVAEASSTAEIVRDLLWECS